MRVEFKESPNDVSSWDALEETLALSWHKEALRLLFKYCRQNDIAPSDVCDDVMEDYAAWLMSLPQVQWPHVRCRDSKRAWNILAGTNPKWPRVRLNPYFAGVR